MDLSRDQIFLLLKSDIFTNILLVTEAPPTWILAETMTGAPPRTGATPPSPPPMIPSRWAGGNMFFCQQAVDSCCGLRSVAVIIVLLMMCPALKQDFFQVSETKCCCFFKRKMRKKKTGRSKWPPGFGKIQKFLSRGGGGGGDAEEEMGGAVSHAHSRGCEELKLLKSDKSENVSGGESKV